ncbi:MAG: Rpn family recombination-promoting nuclease/putative transposase [Myxococcota bacterium]
MYPNETSSSQSPQSLKLPPYKDVVFRRLFGNSEDTGPLLNLLNGILDWEEPIVKIILQPNELSEGPAWEKRPALDLRAEDGQSRLYNIEVQLTRQEFYAERALYYWSKVHASQLKTGDSYGKLRTTVGIHFLDWLIDWGDEIESKQDREFWSMFQVMDPVHGRVLTQQLMLHMIEMPALNKTPEELTSARERWIYFVHKGHKLTEAQVESMGDDIKQANTKLMRLSQEQALWHTMESIERAERDRMAFFQDHLYVLQQKIDKAEEKAQQAEEKAQQAEEKANQAE